LPDDVPPAEKTQRFLALERLQRRIQSKVYARYVSRTVSVLVEGESARSMNDMTGHSTCHKVVNFTGDATLCGQVVEVTITEAKPNSLYGQRLS
jgi:tRNA-2-methylthio-N6-dimethylallyladenosine synthase